MNQQFKLMAVLAHPDDESLGFGGTLAKYAAAGVETYLVTATRGECGRFGSLGKRGDPAEVGRVREAELRAAAAVLVSVRFRSWATRMVVWIKSKLKLPFAQSCPASGAFSRMSSSASVRTERTGTRTTLPSRNSRPPRPYAPPMRNTPSMAHRNVIRLLLTAFESSTIWRGEVTSGRRIRPPFES